MADDNNVRGSADDTYDASQFYWDALDEKQRADIQRPRPDRCPWCKGIFKHHPLCQELRRDWSPTMAWGKHRGKRLVDIDTEYLEWLLKRDINDELRKQVVTELNERE